MSVSSSTTVEPGKPVANGAGPSPGPLIDPRGTGPFRAELLGPERLEAQARLVASACVLAPARKASSPLLRRFAENGRFLVRAHGRIVGEGDRLDDRGLDAEWLADNFHIVEDVLREVRRDLPTGYDEELPKLANEPIRDYPRVYAMALSLIAHTDGEIDETRLEKFVQAFQEVAPLTIGELWALPTMLRLVLLENLRRLSEQMLWGWDERQRAERWASDFLAASQEAERAAADGENRSAPTVPLIANPTDPLFVRLLQLLRDHGPEASEALDRMAAKLEGKESELDEVLRRENRRQAANQVSVANCVISLRVLSAIDWNTFFERESQVEAVLRDDPAGAYAGQDFGTRDRYRRVVETVARDSDRAERDVALRAIALAHTGQRQNPLQGHVGYYLAGPGRAALNAAFGYRPPWRERALNWARAHPRATYFGPILIIFLSILAILGGSGFAAGANPWIGLLLLAALMVPASEIAVTVVNHVLTLVLPPRVLPKMEFKEGIPEEYATMVVMPSMLVRPQSAAALVERLEIHYLANPDPQLRFALLTDFADAPAERMPEDDEYVHDALKRVKALNDRYAPFGPPRFFIFHRKRIWNPVQGCWMGWERKRGKLSEYNRLMRGDRKTSYAWLSTDAGELPRVRFVITLDADTQMPRDSARRLVGTLAHPLNTPRFDPAFGRVVEGFGVLQPRVSFHLTAATHSRFAALLAASGGIDPYSIAASDTYMDLFGVGSFTGKGIYDLDAFEAATERTFPENQILSHDLIEGNYARCGLASDTELFDDFPARYHAYARREHRWVRGDWQLLPWLGRRVPTADGPRPNPLPTLERWKLFDNLRRSLVPPGLVLLLALGWTVLPGSPWLWTAVALAIPAMPVLQVVASTLVGSVRSRSLAGVLGMRDSVPSTAGQSLLTITFLADRARTLIDAVVRTLVRLFITRRHMLEWETAASTERRMGSQLTHFFEGMWPAPAIAVALAILVAIVHPSALVPASPVLAAWLLSPLVAYWVSRPRPSGETPLTETERRELRRVARRTWHFFETFVGDEDHWLPPDNFQEDPHGKVAHRTSPTNQGLLLLSTLAAHDFGYIGLRTLVERLEKTLDTFDRMEKHWGHFYNWYNTKTLDPLNPTYISTVDSGNLLGCLITLKRGLAEKAEMPLLGPTLGDGLVDTLGVAAELIRSLKHPAGSDASEAYRSLEGEIRRIEQQLRETPADLLGWNEWLGRLDWSAHGLIGRVRTLGESSGTPLEGLETWIRRFVSQVQQRRAELASVAPWLVPLHDFEAHGAPAWADEESERKWRSVRAALVTPTSITELAGQVDSISEELTALEGSSRSVEGLRALAASIRESSAAELLARVRRIAERSEATAAAMDFQPLYKPERHLFAIGCNLVQGRLDGACYDLLASESALTSLLTIARGDAPRRHWFQLGRPYTRAAGRMGLISWGGTMFEYLMPRLMMRALPGTLVAEAATTAVERQIEYGKQSGVPWGISESSFGARNPVGDYDYQAFGVPGLGLKRGLDRDLVIAPYATALATMVVPHEALVNFRRLALEGGEGLYGFYESIDFTPERLSRGQRSIVVRSYMAHHQGMSLVALANAVLDEPMPRRFHAEPMVRAVELLLQERIPRDAPLVEPSETVAPGQAPEHASVESGPSPLMTRRLTTPHTPAPRIQLLSNNRYHVMITNAGSGSSSCDGLDVTRWREDSTRDAWGQFVYVRDIASGLVWSAGHQPVGRPAEEYEVVFAADKASFRRRDLGIETLLEVTVSPEQPAEVRRVTLTNLGTHARELDVTSYAEVVLAPRASDLAHPAFGKLFLETEWLPGPEALICRRRPRSRDQRPTWAVHVAAVDGPAVGDAQHETDRGRFLGRGRTPSEPAALGPNSELSGTTGPVLDPIFSLRRRVRLEPGESAIVAFTTALADSHETALALADQYHHASAVARAFELAWAQSLIEHRHRGWSPGMAHLYQRLASQVIHPGTALRVAPTVLASNRQGQSALWKHGVSGDRPIVLAKVADPIELPLVRQLLDSQSYLRLKGLEFDLVLLDEQATGYSAGLSQQIRDLAQAAGSIESLGRPGGFFIFKADQLPPGDRALLQAAARVVLVGDRGLLDAQLDRFERTPTLPGPLSTTREPVISPVEEPDSAPALLFDNGFGGFTEDGREYRITVRNQPSSDIRRNGKSMPRTTPRPILPPAPWVNVVANPLFGFLVSESGAGYTWSGNSQTNRITPWSNDPVSDPAGEVVYLRDEETGEVWTPTPLPIPSSSPTTVRHGQGYSVFEPEGHGLSQELTLFVSPDDPVKLIVLKVRNISIRTRRLSATFYVEWVLGTTRETTSAHVATAIDPQSGALTAQNSFRDDFADRVAFVDVDRRPRTLTADRAEFLGRNGSVAAPAAMRRTELSGRAGAALDPCAAIQTPFELKPGEDVEILFLLGEAANLDEARELVRRYREPGRAGAMLQEVQSRWETMLSAVQVRTPDPAMDLLLNRWLVYQVLSCRVWGRSAFYQSGGAYGFRDQLQDVMALVHAAPAEAKAHILRAASRQFAEGDVQHWWHPPSGRGVRTRFSDDYLWLPLVACHYADASGDMAIFDEHVPYLEGPILRPEQEDDYGLPSPSGELASLYDHCVRALKHGWPVGPHGLPLMGAGDWNDGMNRVGSGGTGESVWDAWFQVTILRRFADLAEARGDSRFAVRCRDRAEALRAAVEKHAWDGDWYRRAYFDDGTPLGSAKNDECQIDSIAQTWAVISGAGDPERVRRALAAVEDRLVNRKDRLILLLAPPFDRGVLEPGYIKGYVPGIRENGGQYTHAATWLVMAEAMLGRGGRAVALFDLINPIRHADHPDTVNRYRVEPYVVAADVYGLPPHTGRGGWTWYTGSASWLYRVALESILGVRSLGDRLIIDPSIPADWPHFEVTFRYRSTLYRISVENPDRVERGVRSIRLDGLDLADHCVPLTDDARTHDVVVVLGGAPA